MTISAAFRLQKEAIQNLRRVRNMIGYSEAPTNVTIGPFFKLPFATQIGLVRYSFFPTANLLIYRYHEIFTHLTTDEKLVLYFLASKLKKSAVAVEIGSFLGASACFIALGLGRKGRLFCVDTWNNDAMDEPQRDTFKEFSWNVRHFPRVIVSLKGSSVSVAETFDRRIDFLFIDADHSYEECLKDWLSWSRFLAPGAIVGFHDIGWADGVIKVVKEQVTPLAKREVRMNNMYLAWL